MEAAGAQSAEEMTGSDILVVYFSHAGEQYGVGVIGKGNTALVAEMIAEQTGQRTRIGQQLAFGSRLINTSDFCSICPLRINMFIKLQGRFSSRTPMNTSSFCGVKSCDYICDTDRIS